MRRPAVVVGQVSQFLSRRYEMSEWLFVIATVINFPIAAILWLAEIFVFVL